MAKWNTPLASGIEADHYPLAYGQIQAVVDFLSFPSPSSPLSLCSIYSASRSEFKRLCAASQLWAPPAVYKPLSVRFFIAIPSGTVICVVFRDSLLDGVPGFCSFAPNMPTWGMPTVAALAVAGLVHSIAANTPKPPTADVESKHKCTCTSRDLFINMGCTCKPTGLKEVPWIFDVQNKEGGK